MKLIKAINQPFDAILSGSVKYSLNEDFQPIDDQDAETIRQRWGALVEIQSDGSGETFTASEPVIDSTVAAPIEEPVPVEEAPAEAVETPVETALVEEAASEEVKIED